MEERHGDFPSCLQTPQSARGMVFHALTRTGRVDPSHTRYLLLAHFCDTSADRKNYLSQNHTFPETKHSSEQSRVPEGPNVYSLLPSMRLFAPTERDVKFNLFVDQYIALRWSAK